MSKPTKEQIRNQNRNKTKTEIVAYLDEMKRNNNNIIMIEANKRRTNVTINEGVLRLIEERYPNKSGLIEDLLIELLEKELEKKIEITKYTGNYPITK
jgi:predicted transcriptional regulator with HTH domain